MTLKTLKINGKEFQYQVIIDNGEDGSFEWTKFYQGTTTTIYKKYWLFGEELIKIEPRFAFNIWKNIESENYTKAEIRKWLEREVELLDRKEEIKRGEII